MDTQDDLSHRLRDVIESAGYRHNDRIPPERDLCKQLGTTRNQLRKALAELEAQGRIWRHVGRGTFVGARPVLNLQDVTYLGDRIKPDQVMACATTSNRNSAAGSTACGQIRLRTIVSLCKKMS